MAMAEQSTVIGVFRDRSLAEQAIRELKHVGFRDDQISLVGQGHAGSGSGGGPLSGLRNLFSGHSEQDTASETTGTGQALPQELEGVAPGEAAFYQQELQAGHSIVVVHDYGHQQQAHDILYQYGAYDSTAASAGVAGAGMGTGTRTVPIREERLNVSKQVVQVGEIRIHKRVITENKTITVPVQREEVYIERIPTGNENAQALENALRAQGFDIASGTTTGTSASQGYLDPTRTNTTESVVGQQANFSNQGANTTTVGQNATNYEDMLRDGGTIRILVREERVVVAKQPTVIEEILIRKQQVQETRQVAETVRHEEAHIERSGDIVVHDDDIEDVANNTIR
jgi:stress response protein YsnF